MELSSKQLEEVKRMAAAAFTPAEVAEVLEVDEDAFILAVEERGPIRSAFRSGFLTRQLELRERIFQDAKNGSSPAQTIANKLLEDSILKSKIR